MKTPESLQVDELRDRQPNLRTVGFSRHTRQVVCYSHACGLELAGQRVAKGAQVVICGRSMDRLAACGCGVLHKGTSRHVQCASVRRIWYLPIFQVTLRLPIGAGTRRGPDQIAVEPFPVAGQQSLMPVHIIENIGSVQVDQERAAQLIAPS